jgi:hypothetical protein
MTSSQFLFAINVVGGLLSLGFLLNGVYADLKRRFTSERNSAAAPAVVKAASSWQCADLARCRA